jgi:hypothetical protein
MLSTGTHESGPAPVGVLVCHPAGQRGLEQVATGWWPVPRALAATGEFVCLACDFGDGTAPLGPRSGPYSWGNEHALAQMSRAWEFLADPRVGARRGRIVVAGTSMGALLALKWARRHRSAVAALVLGCPVLDLDDVYRNDKGGLRVGVAAAYGIEPGEALPGSATVAPADLASELAGLPIRIYASDDDPVASDTQRCRTWARTVGEGSVSVVGLGPSGHWPVGTPSEDAVAFVRGLV